MQVLLLPIQLIIFSFSFFFPPGLQFVDFGFSEPVSSTKFIIITNQSGKNRIFLDEISKYCEIEDVHMKEAELEDILKEIYKGAHKC